MKIIKTVGVAGAGKMGSAIAQKFAQEGFSVVLLDREEKFVENGIRSIREVLEEGIARRIFSEEKVKSILANITPSANLEDFKRCDIIIEAIFENYDVKTALFRDIDSVVGPDVILATNTSSFSVSELAESVSHPERFVGLHYFYHASKNRLVEIIPGKDTSEETINSVKLFCILSGKDQITCKDSYGFVVNRFFVPWLNESVKLLEEGHATPYQIDKVCEKVFSIGMGPFALMNATGVPIAYHSQKTLERFGNSYAVSALLKNQTESSKQWLIEESADEIKQDTFEIIKNRMLGIVFFVCSQLLDEKVCSAIEINRGARIGLKWRRGPIELMSRTGEEKVKKLISGICSLYKESIPESVGSNYWTMEYISTYSKGKNAVITLSKPEDMNALNEVIVEEINDKFTKAEGNPETENIFITGSGKAFVAGADIKFFVENIKSNTLDKIQIFTEYGQSVLRKIDSSKKKVISVINGLTLGGGLELALCSDIILSFPGSVFSFPETGIGIYPGLGGTQRTQKRIGKALTKYLIYTGNMLTAEEALKIGLIDGIVLPEQMFELFEGKSELENLLKSKPELDKKYISLSDYFGRVTVKEILNNQDTEIPETILKLINKIKQKAPLALYTAEKLIDEGKGPESELEHLDYIFSTKDALLGLTSIGKKVQYQGN
ncbi:MAG: 3-hydroxyacyl-CoA dehydrogenase/enoyl-CoA hydratase family protein [Ignavibacteria bacterium]